MTLFGFVSFFLVELLDDWCKIKWLFMSLRGLVSAIDTSANAK